MDSLFSEIKRQERLSDRVQAQIHEVITGQKLQAGDKLPPERELAEQLGVSRTVVREAIRSLAAQGLLDVRTGSGMYVRDPSPEFVSESMNHLIRARVKDRHHVYEVRRVLEVEIAGLAANRATSDDVDELAASVSRISKKHLPPAQFADEDVGFHARLAQATQNELYRVLLNSISDVMREVRLLGSTLPKTQEQAAHFHSLIFNHVKNRDLEGARAAMSAHIDESIATMTEAIEIARKNGHRVPL